MSEQEAEMDKFEAAKEGKVNDGEVPSSTPSRRKSHGLVRGAAKLRRASTLEPGARELRHSAKVTSNQLQ